MQIEVKIDSSLTEAKVEILTPQLTEEISGLVKNLSAHDRAQVTGFHEGVVALINLDEVTRVYAANQKVFAQTDEGTYQLRMRLYEVEERTDPKRFVRISKSEIINLNKVKGFDMSFVGTICVYFASGEKTFVSRRYMARIKDVLGV